ncbi:MAG: DUF697 domain-containing protein [Cytophagales bacterium]|nr:MAG: DUF697 domain-containing protein [Cytophagales bacterium]TAF60842.1 MAG: DUF697 domain-containing protein [Cytophagales bacterium]
MLDFILFKLKQKLQIEDNQEKADKVVESAVMLSVGAGILPVPIADLVLVTAIQVDMVRQLAAIYNIQVQFTHLESWLNTLSASILPQIKGEAIKTIPGAGKFFGGESLAILSGASTYAIGRIFVKHFEGGGQITDFKAELVQAQLQEEFEQGKKVAAEASIELEKKTKKFSFFQDESPIGNAGSKPEQPFSGHAPADNASYKAQSANSQEQAAATQKTDDALKKLTELTELLEKGLITIDEFKLLKIRVLSNL